MRICICGGGNLGHVCAGFLANRGHQVSILTTKPERWSQTIGVVAPDRSFEGKLAQVSSHPDEVIPQAEIVLVCLPGFAIHDELTKIKPYLSVLHFPRLGKPYFASLPFGAWSVRFIKCFPYTLRMGARRGRIALPPWFLSVPWWASESSIVVDARLFSSE